MNNENYCKMPPEILDRIKVYSIERCKNCEVPTIRYNFCSDRCRFNYHYELIEFLGYLVVFIFVAYCLLKFTEFILQPLRIVAIIFVYFILIPTWIVSNIAVPLNKKWYE